MFYLNDRRDLLVVRRGLPIPPFGPGSGRWRKKKGAVSVSDEIHRAVQKNGYYVRKLKQMKVSKELHRPRSR
jgi:hypothetical protein